MPKAPALITLSGKRYPTLEEIKIDVTLRRLELAHWCRSEAARSLGVSARTVHRIIIEAEARGLLIPDSIFPGNFKLRREKITHDTQPL